MGFLSLDGTFWIQLLNFAIFFALLNAVFLKPVGEGVRKRRERMDGLISQRDALQEQAAHLRVQADAERQAARRDAEAILARSRAEASNESASIASDYNRRAAERVTAAQASAEEELRSAAADADRLAGQLAQLAVGRVLSGASQ